MRAERRGVIAVRRVINPELASGATASAIPKLSSTAIMRKHGEQGEAKHNQQDKRGDTFQFGA